MEMESSVFISDVEKEIILLRNNGNSFVMVGNILNCDEKETEKIYNKAMYKVQLLQKKNTDDNEHIFPCETISDFLDQLGLSPKIAGKNELAAAIKLSHQFPEMLDSIQKVFFPELAKQLGLTEKLVKGRVRNAVRYVSYEKDESGTPSYIFYRKAGLAQKRDTNLKFFMLTAHQCINELYEMPCQILRDRKMECYETTNE